MLIVLTMPNYISQKISMTNLLMTREKYEGIRNLNLYLKENFQKFQSEPYKIFKWECAHHPEINTSQVCVHIVYILTSKVFKMQEKLTIPKLWK